MKKHLLFRTLLCALFLVGAFTTVSSAQNGIDSKKPDDSDKVMQVPTINSVDVNTLVQWVMRESYRESVDDLKYQAAKVKSYNEKKKEIRDELKKGRQIVSSRLATQDYLLELELFRIELILDAANKFKRTSSPQQKASRSELNTTVTNLINNMAYSYSGLSTKVRTNLPNRVPSRQVTSLESLNNQMTALEQQLSSMGEDEQFENSELQNMLQKQQEFLEAMANVSKLLHDTAKSIIGKMK